MVTRRSILTSAAVMSAGLAFNAATARRLFAASEQPRLNATKLAKFVDALPVPAVLTPDRTRYGGLDYYTMSMTQFSQKLHRDLPPTLLWGYNGQYPGPTIEARSTLPHNTIAPGRPVKILHTSALPDRHLLPVDTTLHCGPGTSACSPLVRTVVHLHGGHVGPDSDGDPEAWFSPGFAQTGPAFLPAPFLYPNDQDASTLWYHDHALGITRLNVYAGLAGLYLIRDDQEDSLNLPRGSYEIPLLIQDRRFHTDGSLDYATGSEPQEPLEPAPSIVPEFFGDTILVNGKAWPYLQVEPRKYRFRIVNGSNSRFYDLFLSSQQSFHQIGTDGGLLNEPVTVPHLVVAPGERADVIVDFSGRAGQTVTLRNTARSPFPKGETPDPLTVGQIMQFRVTKPLAASDTSVLPDVLRPWHPISPLTASTPARALVLVEETDALGRLRPQLGTAANGPLMWDDPVTERPTLNSTEIWTIINATEDAHPVHLHLVQFQILSRQRFETHQFVPGQPETLKLVGQPAGPEANEAGWKDTVRAYPGEVTRIIATFDKPGRYVWHCHILEHEDHEMMRPFVVEP